VTGSESISEKCQESSVDPLDARRQKRRGFEFTTNGARDIRDRRDAKGRREIERQRGG